MGYRYSDGGSDLDLDGSTALTRGASGTGGMFSPSSPGSVIDIPPAGAAHGNGGSPLLQQDAIATGNVGSTGAAAAHGRAGGGGISASALRMFLGGNAARIQPPGRPVGSAVAGGSGGGGGGGGFGAGGVDRGGYGRLAPVGPVGGPLFARTGTSGERVAAVPSHRGGGGLTDQGSIEEFDDADSHTGRVCGRWGGVGWGRVLRRRKGELCWGCDAPRWERGALGIFME